MTPRQEAARVIRSVLAAGPRTAGEVERAADAVGLSVRTLRRAADECGVTRTRQGAAVMWSLPSQTAGDGHCAPVRHRRGSHADGVSVPAGATPNDTEEIDEMTDTETADEFGGPRFVEAVRAGLTIGGHVLAPGDVVELPERGTDAHAATCDRHGVSWADDLSKAAQTARWGEVHVRPCPPPAIPSSTDGEAGSSSRSSRGEPVRPTALPSGPGAFPSGRRVRPEGSVPTITGLHGDGPVTITPARRSEG